MDSPLLSGVPWSHLRLPGPRGLWVTFWEQPQHIIGGTGSHPSLVPLNSSSKMPDARGFCSHCPPWVASFHLVVLNASYRAVPPSSCNTQQLLDGADLP